MRKISPFTVVCALGIAAASLMPAAAQAETITIVRGTATEVFDTAKTPAGGVHQIRPANKMPPAPDYSEKRKSPRFRLLAAGDTLWLRDRRTRRLVACFTGSSGIVGKTVIRCTGPDAFGR